MPEGSAALSTGQSAAPCCCLYTGGCRVGTRLVRVELCSLLSRLVTRSVAASANGRACTLCANLRLCLPGGRLRVCLRERLRAGFPKPGSVPGARPPSAGPGCPFKRGPGAVSIAAPGSFPLLPFRSAAIRGAAARAGPRDGQPRAAAGAAPPTAARAAPRGLPRGCGALGHRGVAAGPAAGRADAPESVCARRTAQ